MILRGRLNRKLAKFRAFGSAPTPTPTPSPRPPADYTVSNLTELNSALTTIGTAGGKIIDLTPGAYGNWTPATRTYTAEVTIRGQNPADKPVLTTILKSSGVTSGLIFEDIAVKNPAANTGFATIVYFNLCDRLTFRRCSIRGGTGRKGNGFRFLGCTNVLVEQCNIQQTGDTGIYFQHAAGVYSSNCIARHNSITDGGADCIALNGVNNFVIEQNYLSNMYPEGLAHCDGIQIFQNDPNNPVGTIPRPCDNGQVLRNFCRSQYNVALAASGRMQGVFCGPAYEGYNQTNMIIDENIVIAGQANSIHIARAPGVVMRNNKVYDIIRGDGLDGATMHPQNSSDIVFTGNLSPAYNMDAVTFSGGGGLPGSNTTSGAVLANDAAADVIEAAWIALYPLIPYNEAY